MGMVSLLTAGGPRGWQGGISSSVRHLSPSCPCGRCFPSPGHPSSLCGAFPAVSLRPMPASLSPWLSPYRDGRLVPEAQSLCASWPWGHVPQWRLAGHHGVCPLLGSLPPGCGRAAVCTRRPLRKGEVCVGGEGGALCGRLPVWASVPMHAPTLPPHPCPPLLRPPPRPSHDRWLVVPSRPLLGMSLSAHHLLLLPPPP